MFSIVISPSALLLAAAGITLEGKNSLNSLHVFDYACANAQELEQCPRERETKSRRLTEAIRPLNTSGPRSRLSGCDNLHVSAHEEFPHNLYHMPGV